MKRLNENAKKEVPLSYEQKELAEKNHSLIYAFAKQNNVDIDEHYGALAEALCKAARSYDKNKGKFSTLAYTCMRNEINMHHRKSNNDIECERIDEGKFDIESIYDDQETNMIAREFEKVLNLLERRTLKLLIEGLTQKEIADIMDCSAGTVCCRVKSIRDKAVEYFDI